MSFVYNRLFLFTQQFTFASRRFWWTRVQSSARQQQHSEIPVCFLSIFNFNLNNGPEQWAVYIHWICTRESIEFPSFCFLLWECISLQPCRRSFTDAFTNRNFRNFSFTTYFHLHDDCINPISLHLIFYFTFVVSKSFALWHIAFGNKWFSVVDGCSRLLFDLLLKHTNKIDCSFTFCRSLHLFDTQRRKIESAQRVCCTFYSCFPPKIVCTRNIIDVSKKLTSLVH